MPITAERRTMAAEFEFRTVGDQVQVEGYASVFNQPYDMGVYREEVAPGAFRKTLTENPDVRFLINHDGLPLARTTSGTLELSEDSTGLHMRAALDPADPDVARLVPKMQRGDLNQMSFAFRTIKDNWSDDYSMRTLQELSLRDGDVSAVTYPASPTTTIGLRNAGSTIAAAPVLARYLAELREGKTLSSETMTTLQGILDAVAAADVYVDQVLVDLSAFMGVENPDILQDSEMDDAPMNGQPETEGYDVQARPLASTDMGLYDANGAAVVAAIAIAKVKAAAARAAARK